MTYGHLEVPSSTGDTPVAHLALVPHPHGVLCAEIATLAIQLVDRSGVVQQLEAWKAEARKGPGGRPETFGFRALLVAMATCALTDQPLHLTQVCNMMSRQFSPELRATLGTPDPPEDHDSLGMACSISQRAHPMGRHDRHDRSDRYTEKSAAR